MDDGFAQGGTVIVGTHRQDLLVQVGGQRQRHRDGGRLRRVVRRGRRLLVEPAQAVDQGRADVGAFLPGLRFEHGLQVRLQRDAGVQRAILMQQVDDGALVGFFLVGRVILEGGDDLFIPGSVGFKG